MTLQLTCFFGGLVKGTGKARELLREDQWTRDSWGRHGCCGAGHELPHLPQDAVAQHELRADRLQLRIQTFVQVLAVLEKLRGVAAQVVGERLESPVHGVRQQVQPGRGDALIDLDGLQALPLLLHRGFEEFQGLGQS